jgi:hypothetical protein
MAFLLWFKTLLMKTVIAPRITILSVCMIVLQQVGFSQGFSSAHEVKSSDNLHSGELISTYREFFKNYQYNLALYTWWTNFNYFPELSFRYLSGSKAGIIVAGDTLLWITKQ